MTSEIRVNKLTNRIGLSTVTFADSGIGVTVTGRIDPDTDSARDLGTTSVRWRNAYVDTYYGDGSNLTGISAGTSLSGSTNNTVCTVTGANAIQGEANLTFETSTSGGTLTVAGTSEYQIKLKDTNNSGNAAETALAFTDSGDTIQGFVGFNYWGDGNLDIQNNNSGGSVCINTGGGNERLKITSGGNIQLPVNGQQLTWGASQQMKFYYENSEDRMYLQGDGAYGFAFRVNGGNRIEISKTTGDVTMQGSGGKNFQWDNSAADLYLTDSGSGASARLKIGSGGDLQLYHDVGGVNHIVCATNQELKLSANSFSFYDYTGVTQRFKIKPVEIDTYDSLGINVNGGNVNHTNDAVLYAGKTGNADWCIKAQTPGNDYGLISHTGSGAAFSIAAYDGSNFRFRVRGDGVIYASNTTIQSISDVRLKENIVDANSQWDDIKALRFRNFNWKSDSGLGDGKTYLGLIAQEVEPISPNLIDLDAQTKEDIENGVPDPEHKSVKYSIVWMKAVKALQEAMTRIEKLEDDNTALRARITNLEGN